MNRRAPSPASDEVVLRDVTEGDLAIFYGYQLEPQANAMAAFPAKDKAAFTTHWMRILGDETIIKQTILCDGQVAGNIVSFEQSGERAVGYWIGRQYWGQGVATRALAAFLGHIQTRPLYAHVAKHNLASRRVLEKCGFTVCHDVPASSGAHDDGVEEVVLALRE